MAREDLADSAAEVLLAPAEHEGRTYDLTGPESLTIAEIAARLSVPYVEETLEEAWASRAPSGAPDWEIEGWVITYTAIAAGELDAVTDHVRRPSGHDPLSFDDFLEN